MNICKSDIYFLILIMLFLILFYKIYKLENIKEGFDATSDMKAVINQVYNADIESIRNLSSIATQLTTNGGLVMPGSLKVASKLATNNLDPNNMPDGWGGGLRIYDGYASGTMGFGPDGKSLKAYMNSSGNAMISGNLDVTTIKTGAITSDDWFRVKNDNGFYFQDRGGGWHMSDNTWIRSYGGKNVYCNAEIRANRMSTEGSMVIDGDLVVKGNIVLDGDNKWIIHTPDDGRKTLYIAPFENGGWNWGKQFKWN
jgi:hypothetical protein